MDVIGRLGALRPEDILNGVTDYLDLHPVTAGATAAQAQQITRNASAVSVLAQNFSSILGTAVDVEEHTFTLTTANYNSFVMEVSASAGDVIHFDLLSYDGDNFSYANVTARQVGTSSSVALARNDTGKKAIYLGESVDFTLPFDCERISITVTKSSTSTSSMTFHLYLRNFYNLISRISAVEHAVPTSMQNPLYGKKLALNGDSICFGTGYAGGYGKIIGNRNGMTVQNIAASGATIATGTSATHFICNTIDSMAADADYCILEGGFNDCAKNVALGTFSNSYTADKSTLNTTTFVGAFEYMLISALQRYVGKKIGFIVVHNASDNYGSGKNVYYDMAVQLCHKWDVPVLDLRNELGYSTFISTEYNQRFFTNASDGSVGRLHPTEEGYKVLYAPKIETWMMHL